APSTSGAAPRDASERAAPRTRCARATAWTAPATRCRGPARPSPREGDRSGQARAQPAQDQAAVAGQELEGRLRVQRSGGERHVVHHAGRVAELHPRAAAALLQPSAALEVEDEGAPPRGRRAGDVDDDEVPAERLLVRAEEPELGLPRQELAGE